MVTGFWLAAGLACAWAANAADAPALRPDGDAPGHGSQRLSVEATRFAHAQFSADACLAEVDILAFRPPDPKRPLEDQFAFTFRSPTLTRMRFEAIICLPQAAGSVDPRCRGEWELQARKGELPRCLSGRQADSGEVLLVARRDGLPKPPIDGLRLGLRAVGKSGKGLAAYAKLKGRNVWIVESRDECRAVDSQTLQILFKGPCSKLRWPE